MRIWMVGIVVVLGWMWETMAAPVKLGVDRTKSAVATTKPATNVTARSAATMKVPAPAPARAAATVKTPIAAPARVEKPVVEEKPVPETEGSAGGIGLTLKVGTLGGGLEATVGASDYLGFRFGINKMSVGPSIERDEGTINTDLDWLSYGALADWHMFGGGFRLTGGGLINKNKFKLTADLTESVELDGQEYRLSDLQGEVTFATLAPYVGIGYGNAVGADGRWHFSCDFGVMFQGEPKISASATASDPGLQPAVDAALDREVADIQNEASDYKYYPVIALGISYRF